MDDSIPVELPSTLVTCIRFYSALYTRAEPAAPYPIYDGFPTALFRELGYSVNDYGRIVRRLLAMGCIEQLKRGAAGQTSKWALLEMPNLDAFAASRSPVKKPSKARMDKLEEAVVELRGRVEALEGKLT